MAHVTPEVCPRVYRGPLPVERALWAESVMKRLLSALRWGDAENGVIEA